MKLDGRFINKAQLYDENENPEYPITHVDAIIGGVEGLDLGTTLSLINLDACITAEYKGSLKIKSFNNSIYTFCIDIKRADDDLFKYDKTLILARDIPDMVDKVEFKAVGNGFDDVQIWLENNYLKAIVKPRTERFYDSYVPSVDRIIGSGLIIR